MALGDAYCTVQEYRDQTGKTSSDDDLALARELVAISRHIDKVTVRPLGFNRDPALDDLGAAVDPVARYYTLHRAWRTLDIDDHVTVSSIAIDEERDNTFSQSLATTDYLKLPQNAPTMPQPEPYRQLAATEWGAIGFWPSGTRIRVTGYGGWPAVPEAIIAATIELTSILRLESPRATNRINEVGQVLSTSRVARDIIGKLVSAYRPGRTFI